MYIQSVVNTNSTPPCCTFIFELPPRLHLLLLFRCTHLGADDAADALRGLADGVEGEEVVLGNLKRLPQVLQPRAQDAAESVLVGHPEHDHAPPVVPVEVDAFRHLAPRHTARWHNTMLESE
eukprot:1178921-Prorocentrum_minimum.AAC.5